MHVLRVGGFPLRTVPCFYGDPGRVPLEHHEGPVLEVRVYRLRADWSPPGR
jgi:hypothetical protein